MAANVKAHQEFVLHRVDCVLDDTEHIKPGQDWEGVKGCTFTKIAYMLAIDRSAVIVNVGHQKLVEGFHNGSPNTVIGHPFDGIFHLNAAWWGTSCSKTSNS